MKRRAIVILLIEDNSGDVRLLREAFTECGVEHHLEVVADGVEAIRYLRREAPYPGVSLPDLILLDLNLPKKDGREVLSEIKTDARLRRIPVIILSSSDSAQDIVTAYDRHANCYIRKPLDLDGLFSVVDSIRRFWIETVTLPRKDP